MRTRWLTGGLLLAGMACAQAALAFTLTVDRTNYLAGETPTYSISGAPANAPIVWSSWLNGASTGETNQSYGQTTDGSGNWNSLAGAAWSAQNVGFWTKQASVGGVTAQVNFYVSPDLPSLTPGPATPAGQMLGVDDWNGAYPEFHLSTEPLPVEDADLIQNLNSKTILIPMIKTITADFPNTTFSATPLNNLTELAQTAIFQKIFAMPFTTFVLTAYAYNDLTPLKSPNLAAEQQEIADLTAYLLQTYKGTNKTFIIKNWEGDHELFGNDPNHPAAEHQFPYTYQAPADITTKMTNWLNARHQGVVQGRAQAGAVTGVAVHDAAEFVYLYEPLQNLPSMLTTVIPNVQSDYISYSSYDTINRSVGSTVPLRRLILDDLTYLRHYPGLNGRPLMIGEFGYKLSDFPSDAPTRAAIATQAFSDSSIPLALYWVAADFANGFGLVTPTNTRTAIWNQFRTLMGAQNNATLGTTSISNIMVPGNTYTVSIQLQNTGNVPWNSVNTYRLISQGPANNTVWGVSGADFADGESIAPNTAKTFQFTVTAPAAGNYVMQWQLTQGVVGPFGPLISVPILVGQPPEITSPLTAAGQVGVPFTYQIVATNNPTSYPSPFGDTQLPTGLTMDPQTGLISGTPLQSGSFNVFIYAQNRIQLVSKTLVLTIAPAAPPPPPVVTPGILTADIGVAIAPFQIVATKNPTSYSAPNLPAGLSLDPVSGIISGTPTAAGITTVNMTATNAGGTSASAPLSITVRAAANMVLTKNANATSAKVGDTVAFTITYQNTGGGNANAVAIADAIPAGSTLVPGSITAGGTLSAGNISWAIATVGAGVSGSVSFQVTIVAGPAITNTASISFHTAAGSVVTGNSNTINIPITVVAPPQPPAITQQPLSQHIVVGQTAAFSVAAGGGTAPLTYQWLKNGVAISGATAAIYTTPPAVSADNGATFSVVVQDAAHLSVTSADAVLTVDPVTPTQLTVTQQPASQRIFVGQTAVFSVTAGGGTAPLTYQWSKNGVAIPGATAAAFTTPATFIADNGASYSVVVKDAAQLSVTSANAVLTVDPLPQPQLSVPPQLPVTASIVVDYPYPVSSFEWDFAPANPAAAIANSAPAPIRTSAPRLDLNLHAVPAGAYTITFRVYDLNTTLAASASASTTLVEVGASFASVNVFPNPFRAARGDSAVTFASLPPGSSVKIFTVSGRHVVTLDAGNGRVDWKLANDSGENVASGIYLYLITDPQGNTSRGKFTVIR